MPAHSLPFVTHKVGDPPHRYAIRDARRSADLFWTGDDWSKALEDARLYGEPADLDRAVKRLRRRHLRRHEPKQLYMLTVIVTVHADEAVSRGDAERFLRDALVLGIDRRRCGDGPTANSLVEVGVPLISLEGGR